VNTKDQDIVCMTARLSWLTPDSPEQLFSEYEQTLFTRAVSLAEKFGKRVSLLVVPANDVWSAIVQTANALQASAVVAGVSAKMAAEDQAFRLGTAWEQAPQPKRQFVFHAVGTEARVCTFRIGPHTPTMTAEDIQLVHRLWLDITQEPGLDKLHHSDIVTQALARFAEDCGSPARAEIISRLRRRDHPLQESTSQPSAPLLDHGDSDQVGSTSATDT
jgi:hypothetical protein